MKYLGGKYRHAHLIAPFINSLVEAFDLQVYSEPFCGMFNVGTRVVAPIRIASDLQPDVIEFHKAVRDGWVAPTTVTEAEYYQVKASPGPSAIRGFVGFQCSFAGKWWGGYARNPKGDTNYALTGSRGVDKLRPGIQGVEFFHRPYWESPQADIIYCDPPYFGTTAYTGVKGTFDSEAFWAWVRERSRSSFVLVSEYTGPPDFHVIWEKKAKITATRNECKDSVEKLFSLTPARYFPNVTK